MADYIFDSWKELMMDFRQSVQKDLEEIHAQKQAVQQMKAEIFSRMDSGRYLRDPERIVISAPEIVIGNVDYSGDLMIGNSSVIVKGNALAFDGVGNDGTIVTRAPRIRQTAVNPGIDGQENVVCDTSEIVNQACGIVIQSNNSQGTFSQAPVMMGDRGGICIHADQSLQLSAAVSCEGRKGSIDQRVKVLDEQIKGLEKRADNKMTAVENSLKEMKKLLAKEDELNQEEGYKVLIKGGGLSLTAQNVTVSSLEASDDGKEYKAKGNFKVFSKNIGLVAMDYEKSDSKKPMTAKAATEGGQVALTAKKVAVSAINPKAIEYDEKGSMTKGEVEAAGDVIVRAKNFTVEAIDYQAKDGKLSPKEQTKGSSISLRTERLNMLSADAEGKATGSVDINAKAINLKAMDVDKVKLTAEKLAEGGTMTLVSDKMYVGATSNQVKSSRIQTVAAEIGTFADKTLEMQQGEGKALLQLDGGNIALGGSKSELYGETTVNGKTEVKGEFNAPKITGSSIEAKATFKSPNISDGMAAVSGGGGSSLSAKMKIEEVKSEKK